MCAIYSIPRGFRKDQDLPFAPFCNTRANVFADWPEETYPGGLGAIVRYDESGQRIVVPASFGLVPFWVKDRVAAKKLQRSTYNARAETVASKPAYRDAWQNRQFCIVPAGSFFESNYETGMAVRWQIARADQKPMGIAGIWNRWNDPAGEPMETFAMITVNATHHPLMNRFYQAGDEKRMVVILEEEDYDAWLAGDLPKRLLRQYNPAKLIAWADPAPSRNTKVSMGGLFD